LALTVEIPKGEDALTAFVLFENTVNEPRSARWPANLPLLLPILAGESPFNRDREVRPLQVRDGEKLLARAAAVVDHRYMRHWKDKLGHIVFFEALSDAREATRLLMDEACNWLAGKGLEAVRTGLGMLDFPYVIDAYETLPPSLLRQNPAYYHVLIKQAGFEAEKGMVDYKIRVRPELIARWESALESARRSGYAIVPLRDVPEDGRAKLLADLWNETFRAHWGWTPLIGEEVALFFMLLEMVGVLDTSVVAYEGDEPVGMLFVAQDMPELVELAPGRVLDASEKMNLLAIGVREKARGRGVNYAMASYALLELVRRGLTWLSYTLVLDDNWPSRRTAEGLGAKVCANYLVYRRNFRR
jgi:GNAT superfamily N-acetyltransferase